MVFRKLADVQREKELAERRKDDPPLDVTTDLAVRKLLSRFRKTSESHARPTSTSSPAELDENSASDETAAAVGQPHNNTAAPAPPPPAAAANKPRFQLSKLIRGAAAATSVVTPITSPSPVPNNTKQNVFVYPDTDKVTTNLKVNGSVVPRRADGVDVIHVAAAPVRSEAAAGKKQAAAAAAETVSSSGQSIDSLVTDMKTDIRRDIDQLNRRVDQIDKQLGTIIQLLTSRHSDQPAATTGGGGATVETAADHLSVDNTAQHSRKTPTAAAVPRVTLSPLFMESISEQEEDQSSSATATNNTRQRGALEDEDKRAQIQHDLEIL